MGTEDGRVGDRRETDHHETDRHDRFPRVPAVDDSGTTVPPVSESRGGAPSRPDGSTAGGCADGRCACGANDTAGAAPTTGAAPTDRRDRVVTDGGGAAAANVDEYGSLGEIEFTPPTEGTSQDLERGGDPTVRVGVPTGVDLDTPDYSIRAQMSDIEERDEKTWFFELDEAVIDADRCIQCGTCVAACPSDSIGIGDDDLPELVKMCTGCSLCWDFCPRGGLRYERQWKITGGEDNVKGAGDPITEFSAKVREDWREGSQDGGVVTSLLIHLLESGEIDGALIATES